MFIAFFQNTGRHGDTGKCVSRHLEQISVSHLSFSSFYIAFDVAKSSIGILILMRMLERLFPKELNYARKWHGCYALQSFDIPSLLMSCSLV
ncbi:unnamed protein product [Cylicocyclus nassatus]|uniref:Uncharacterized protein n=1 Tax=Cylicocyclus nassatus TaxID=53992 RepID=A0AA36H3M5_CYLNA|nr:unnamed protein product [Cylicocyclus nassatus]